LGVASFGHVNGVHIQNLDNWDTYSKAVRRDGLALARAYRPTDEERLIREFVLQLKRGWIRPAYFREKYGVDIRARFGKPLRLLAREGFIASATADRLTLSREGLLRVDALLPRFFLPKHVDIRYT
jgi:oxygen-independent coproporphyrinogen-3 oxidase